MSVTTAPPKSPPASPGQPPALPPSGSAPAGPPPEAPRSGIVWRVVLGCVIVLLCAGGGSAVFALEELHTLRQDLSLNPSLNTAGSLAPTGFGDPQTMLLVGNDQRAKTTTAPVLPHSNEMLLVRFDPAKPYVSMMSVPRELMVPIHTRRGLVTTRLNAALTYGGIPLLVRTIRDVTGLSINHVVEINFGQFKRAINQMGCVYSTVDRRYYHVNVPGGPQYQEIDLQPGYQKLCGGNALSFVSYRHGDTSLVRDARDQSFLLDVKKDYGPTLVDNVHKFEKIFGQSVQTDHGLHTTSGILDLLGTLIGSSSLRVRQVQFQANISPTGPNPCGCDTASPQQISASVNAFLHGGSGLPPKKSVAAVAKAVHRHGGAAQLPLVATSSGGLSDAVAAAANVPFPLEFPRVQDRAGSFTPSLLRAYAIQAPDGTSYAAYVAVFQAGGLGQFYDVQGTTWTTAPQFDSPEQTVQVGARTYYLFYVGQHLEMVAWYEHGAVYWIRNSLTQALGNGEMLAIAEQTAPATTHVGHPATLQAAAVPQRTVAQTNTLRHTLGSLGGLVALVALPLLAVPLIRRRRDVAKLRSQLTATLQFEARLASVLPRPDPRMASAAAAPGRGTVQGHWTVPVYSSARTSMRARLLGGAGALLLLAAGVLGIFINVQGDTPSHAKPRRVAQTVPTVPVAVLNATSQAGAAGTLAHQLEQGGVKVSKIGNVSQSLPAGLLILYAPGARGEAGVLSRALAARKPTVQPMDPVVQAAAGSKEQLVVVIG